MNIRSPKLFLTAATIIASSSAANISGSAAFWNISSSGAASSVLRTKPENGRSDFNSVISCALTSISPVTVYARRPIAGTRSALRIPRQLISELASAPTSDSVEMQQSETCGLEILPSETTSASAPVRKQENTASVSAPGLPRTRFIIPVVTTSSASSDTVSCIANSAADAHL